MTRHGLTYRALQEEADARMSHRAVLWFARVSWLATGVGVGFALIVRLTS